MRGLERLKKQTEELNGKKSKPEPVVADRFVAQGEAKGAPRSTPKRRASSGERVVIYLPAEQAKRLRMQAAEKNWSLSHAVSEALTSNGV